MLSELINDVKNNRLHMPVWMGQILAYVPFGLRPVIGGEYRARCHDIHMELSMSSDQRKEWIYGQMHSIVEYAMNNIPFYKDFYAKRGFTLDMLSTYDDIARIPVIDKDILLTYSLEERSYPDNSGIFVNTGGSSGKTLSLYIRPDQIGHEWAHLHEVWKKVGYRQNMLKIMFVGRNNVKDVVDYDFARHSLAVDIYKPLPEIAERLKGYLRHYPCYFVHGYPSVIADFASYCLSDDAELLALLRQNLKAAFLCSEYPYAKYRDVIESVFGIPTQSFYGHTERCVMAYESDEPYKFKPMQTYGYVEALERADGHFDLIGTSYYNYATPLIRYNTKDLIDDPVSEDGLLKEFHIYEGREGQNILDRSGKVISLTGLIMGRHHPLFDYVEHVQVSQPVMGKALVLYVPKNPELELDCQSLFDSSNVDVEFSFHKLDKPVRTVSGKVNLLVPYKDIAI